MRKIAIFFLISFGLHSLLAVNNAQSCSRTDEEHAYLCTAIHQTKIGMILTPLVSKKSTSIKLELQNIEFLKIDNMQRITRSWFHVEVFVGYLVLKNLAINEIETDAFNEKQFQVLWRLEFDATPLEVLNKGAFNGLTNLRYLSFKDVKLRSFAEKLFQPVYKLQILTMRQCGPHEISLNNLFERVPMKYLTQVSISYCILTDTITKATFWGLRNIDTLELISNQINRIGPNSFDVVLKTATTLTLSMNDLTTLPRDIFVTDHNDIISINLKYNEWHCDCGMEHIRQLAQSEANLNFSEIICVSPPNLVDQDLRHTDSICDDPNYAEKHDRDHDERVESPADEQSIMNGAVVSNPYFLVKCKKMSITIARPSLKMSPVILRKGKLRFNTENVTRYNFMIMYFDQDHVLTDRRSCMVHNSEEKIRIEQKIEPKHLHRVCWKPKEARTIMPLNCVTINLYPQIVEEVKFWILKERMTKVIIICSMSGVGAFVVGMLAAYAWAKIFGKRPSTKKTLKKTRSERMRQQDMINRLKETDKPFRRRFSLKKPELFNKKRIVTQNASYRIVVAADTDISDHPPPLPPRKRSAEKLGS